MADTSVAAEGFRVWAVSDLHVDYEENAQWVRDVSGVDHVNDVLILAGDVSEDLPVLQWCVETLCRKFAQVLFVPGNHELWLRRDVGIATSLEKFQAVKRVIQNSGASMQVLRRASVRIVPLLSWYDHSFGKPHPSLKRMWMDYRACRWPEGWDEVDVTHWFLDQNALTCPGLTGGLDADTHVAERELTTISFSHFLPRIDVMPDYIPVDARVLYPVLGSHRLDAQIRRLNASIHVYGHSHVNRSVLLNDVRYVNCAFGYPHEGNFAGRRMVLIHEVQGAAARAMR